MDFGKRLLRRPVQTLLWLAVLTAMALLAGVGGALAYSSLRLPAALDKHMTTVAVQILSRTQTGSSTWGISWSYTPVALMQEDIEALEHLDMVELVDLRTLTGAYIPKLNAQLGLNDYFDMHQEDAVWAINDSYNQVILTGTVEEAYLYELNTDPWYDISAVGGSGTVKSAYAYAILDIDEVLVANPAYHFFETEKYRQYDGKVYIQAMIYNETGETPFRPGQRYIVSGTYNPSSHGYEYTPPGIHHPWVRLDSRHSTVGSYCFVDGDSVWQYQRTERDSLMGAGEYNPANNTDILLSGENPLTVAEPLEGTVEEFLAAHPQWREQIDLFTMAQHTFPVLGTECLESMQYFVTNAASITQGRTFTQEEYDAGTKVCIISESLALFSGVGVGDAITLSQYLCAQDHLENISLEDFGGLNNPTLGSIPYFHGSEEEELFTVVGIYRLERSWEDSMFAFTPNTVFMPQKAQISGGFGGCSTVEQKTHIGYLIDPETGEHTGETFEYTDGTVYNHGVHGVYLSLKLKNGSMEDFMAALPELGLEEHEFLTFDQGYETAEGSIQGVMRQAWKLLWIAAAGWTLLLMLYVLLGQSRERRNLGTMRSLGARPVQLRRYLFLSGLLPALIGIPLGTLLSHAAAGTVQSRLAELSLPQTGALSGGMALDSATLAQMLAGSQPSRMELLVLAAAELAVLAAVLWLHARMLAKKDIRKLLGV